MDLFNKMTESNNNGLEEMPVSAVPAVSSQLEEHLNDDEGSA